MGCFSWLCKKCGKGILSSSFDGQECLLFLLKDGKVLEVLRGRYDSYGRVFNGPEASQELRVEPIGEPDPDDLGDNVLCWKYTNWHGVCDLEFKMDPVKDKEMEKRWHTLLKERSKIGIRDIEKYIEATHKLEELQRVWTPNNPDMLDQSCGIAAFHKQCYDGVEPTTRSKHDPNQGWGEDWENFGNVGKVIE